VEELLGKWESVGHGFNTQHASHRQVVGKRPRGWLGPGLTVARETIQLRML
jgi:hypothetical protein